MTGEAYRVAAGVVCDSGQSMVLERAPHVAPKAALQCFQSLQHGRFLGMRYFGFHDVNLRLADGGKGAAADLFDGSAAL